jgi:hypothetical protein
MPVQKPFPDEFAYPIRKATEEIKTALKAYGNKNYCNMDTGILLDFLPIRFAVGPPPLAIFYRRCLQLCFGDGYERIARKARDFLRDWDIERAGNATVDVENPADNILRTPVYATVDGQMRVRDRRYTYAIAMAWGETLRGLYKRAGIPPALALLHGGNEMLSPYTGDDKSRWNHISQHPEMES